MPIENVTSLIENRVGDYGRDADGLFYIFDGTEWKCTEEHRRCAIYWQRLYMELLKETKPYWMKKKKKNL